jgi:hypothetical protein
MPPKKGARAREHKPSIIYVRKFFDAPEVLTSENQKSGLPALPKSGLPKNRSQDFRKSETNKNDRNNTELSPLFNDNDLSDTHSVPILSPNPSPFTERKGTEAEPISAFEEYGEIIRENIEHPFMIERFKHDRERIDEIVDLMTETVCSSRKTIRIAGDDYPAEVVRSKFLKLTGTHIEFIMDCLKKNTSEIRNIKKYLLAVLFNAPTTD